MSILQNIYDSEINFEISCFFDSGFKIILGDPSNGCIAEVNYIYGMDNVEKWLKEKILEHLPNSDFARKYKQGDK